MENILNLKFKGNKSFVAFSNLNDTESLTKTWKVCTKVASYLEQGQRLENLSWRLWHLQTLMVDADNARSKREFRKLSRCMGDKLDKEKGRSIEELSAPDFKANHNTEIIRQRAVERERNREASQAAAPGTIQRMQFTFSVEQPSPAQAIPAPKPDFKPDPQLSRHPQAGTAATTTTTTAVTTSTVKEEDVPFLQRGRKPEVSPSAIHFPPFLNGINASAHLYSTPTVANSINYGEGIGLNASSSHDFSVMRPTIELPLDELLGHEEPHFRMQPFQRQMAIDMWSYNIRASSQLSDSTVSSNADIHPATHTATAAEAQDVEMQSATVNTKPPSPALSALSSSSLEEESSNDSDDEDSDFVATPSLRRAMTAAAATKHLKPERAATVDPSKVVATPSDRARTPLARPNLIVKTQNASAASRASGPGATATSMAATIRSNNNTAPGGVKAECSNCGATHTPLWRRGLNDELNCNACGLYCKLHKRPRPKTMRSAHGEHGRAQNAPRTDAVEVVAQCYNCHTTATPLWRKDDEGKTVCNACGLYYKLHGSSRPISMKSDVIRKRSRHEIRRSVGHFAETPSASPGLSRRASLSRETSPTLAPDSSTSNNGNSNFDYGTSSEEQTEYPNSSSSELMGALGGQNGANSGSNGSNNHNGGFYGNTTYFPGPYHPDVIGHLTPADALPFAESSDFDMGMSPRTSKRRRMSVDSESEPPSSATFSSYNDGYASSSSRSSMDFPLGRFPSYGYNGAASNGAANGNGSNGMLRGNAGTSAFWHPPMMPQSDNSPFEKPLNLSSPPMVYDKPLANAGNTSVSNNGGSVGLFDKSPECQEEEMLFQAYVQQPMSGDQHMQQQQQQGMDHGQQQSQQQQAGQGAGQQQQSMSSVHYHPPMIYPEYTSDYRHETYDGSMHSY
ncbi:hypothetical protein FISHEDRAFT_63320 [Fistulina hepatica ATCC 64428]|uniref:GATA-type domain-containing protein n=1 Tax=Fistulina hepatica ATCC 64428 TaxID=1128425 RepID=A0A0D7ARW9_9AGAR|nr:hypothetical protein FISHEDRAFT_63320 [Fistulina hepatica ATCC 64428]